MATIPPVTNHQYLPQKLYHFTPKSNLDEILRNGSISSSCDQETYMSGVFMVALENIKNWVNRYIPIGSCDISFLTTLFCHTAKGEPSIACFRINTDQLKDNIMLRSQQELLKARMDGLTGDFENIENYDFYNKRGDAVEFIHENDITVNESNFVGMVDFPELLNKFFKDCENSDCIALERYGSKPNNISIDVLKKFFVNQPEADILNIIG